LQMQMNKLRSPHEYESLSFNARPAARC